MSGTIAEDRRGWTSQGRDMTGPGYKLYLLNAGRKLQIQKSVQWLGMRVESEWCNFRARVRPRFSVGLSATALRWLAENRIRVHFIVKKRPPEGGRKI